MFYTDYCAIYTLVCYLVMKCESNTNNAFILFLDSSKYQYVLNENSTCKLHG